jgi:hypothetical protein
LCAGDQIGRFPETLQNPVAGALIQRAQGTSEHATIWDHIADIPSLDCTDSQNKLEYMTDSKGFHQPVYLFTLSDENDAALRGGTGWTTFVPALAG